MKRKKRAFIKTRANFFAFIIWIIFFSLMGGILYLIYNPNTRVYTLSCIITIWLYGFWELYLSSKATKVQTKEAP